MSTQSTLAGLRRSPGSDRVLAEVDALLEDLLGQLRGILVEVGGTVPQHGPPGLELDLVGELAERVRHHGKRLRPLLARWGWAAAGGERETRHRLVEVAAALELLQLFALVQDDVMDRSAERRGRPTLHVVAARRHREAGGLGDPELFGDSVAVLVADLALSEATLLASRGEARVARAWRVMATELVGGQLLDVTHTAGRDRDATAARRIARLKSGRYTITRPLQLGALVAGAERAVVDRLVGWGDLVGDAFALRDDVLGVWGDPALTGKPAGDDLRSGKPTVLLVWAGEMLPERHRGLLEACDAGELDEDGARALGRAMRVAGVREQAEATIAETTTRAHDALAHLDTDDATRAALRGLADAVAWRSA
ncbi:polyprenyl synthetase family protein [Phycicoccus endophyticus]|uniref:Polyprenyl synthetase family protein n=1 Tax=Phycicoccus endophyticus TaxID=1690220 RepID=A0A7G9R0J1_9MICO|nr:polyprenyl synthetase family protein [Phycicoccus endophyticus]NHI19393.1 polyprenyl synthetase family protein [Phycicoccus endophyticus]QNN49116.1 polyprenyl synthetase family protein [Phycicoccus endophyticus]GGL38736.1 geranylgeranyl pyrophosphate synthase [Phycicoccus endophyticus]